MLALNESHTSLATPGGSPQLTLNSEQLAVVIDRAHSTVLGDVSRAPHKLPPWLELPGSRRKVWLATTVASWLAGFERPPAAAPTPAPAPNARPKKSKAGHPGNKKIAEAKAAGFGSYGDQQRALRAQAEEVQP